MLVGIGVADFDLVLGNESIDQRADRIAVADLAEGGARPIDDLVVFVFQRANVGRHQSGTARFDEVFQALVANFVVGVGQR